VPHKECGVSRVQDLVGGEGKVTGTRNNEGKLRIIIIYNTIKRK